MLGIQQWIRPKSYHEAYILAERDNQSIKRHTDKGRKERRKKGGEGGNKKIIKKSWISCRELGLKELGWPKGSFSFWSKRKDTFFIFTNKFNNHFVALPSGVCRLLHNSIFPKRFIFLRKELFQVFLQSSRELYIFFH